MPPRRRWTSLAALLLAAALAACAQVRANERPPMNPFFSPGAPAGGRA